MRAARQATKNARNAAQVSSGGASARKWLQSRALEIDLTGQVVADSIGGLIYSRIGGQKDFVRGARLSTGGRAITALPSTAKGGSVSRVVPTITPDAGVTTRGHVQYVATEYGVANLRAESAPGGAADRHLPSRFPARVRAAAVACHLSLPPAPKRTATHLTVPGRRSRIAADRG